MTLETEYKKALKEIGTIEPWFSEEDGLYIFEHPAYPVVDYAGETPAKTITGYKRILKEWIADRLAGNVSDIAEQMTTGRGGKRPGAGRPVGTKGEPKTRIYVPTRLLAEVEAFIAERA